jgi:hypothetical protein
VNRRLVHWILLPLLSSSVLPVSAQPSPPTSVAPQPSAATPSAPPTAPGPGAAAPRAAGVNQAAPADVARAKESFRAGAAAYAAGQYAAAIVALEAAYELAPLPAIAFSLGQAERRQYFVDRRPEHLLRSIELFRRYVQQVQSGGRRSDALEALSQLEPLSVPFSDKSAVAPAPTSTALSTRVMVVSEAPGALISIDGAEPQSSPLIREVSAGKHRVSVAAPGFQNAEREVLALSGELMPISVPLAELPSTVSVSAPDDAEIYVDGAFVSPGGENVILQVKSGRHRVSVAEVGHEVSSRVLDLERGGRQSVRFDLEPTTQRFASHGLLIGGAAVLGAGALLGALAIQSENEAQAFLERRADRNASTAELVRYNADVTRRNRYRLLAGASFATSVGLVVTGLFLHELDMPGPEELNRGGLGVSAVVTPDQVGAIFGGTF